MTLRSHAPHPTSPGATLCGRGVYDPGRGGEVDCVPCKHHMPAIPMSCAECGEEPAINAAHFLCIDCAPRSFRRSAVFECKVCGGWHRGQCEVCDGDEGGS